MKTLNVPINDVDFASLGLANNTISFDELKEKMLNMRKKHFKNVMILL